MADFIRSYMGHFVSRIATVAFPDLYDVRLMRILRSGKI